MKKMTGILGITEGSILAVHVVLLLGKIPNATTTTRELAKLLGASSAHLSKILQALARVGVVRTVRGPYGGYALFRPLSEIRFVDILEATEGPIRIELCQRPGTIIGDDMLNVFWDTIHTEVLQHYQVKLSALQIPVVER